MNTSSPPVVAAWLLEHLTPGPEKEILAGDLLEQFRAGRSAGWYWRQVLAAVGIGLMREVRVERSLIAFALLWNAPIPVLWLYFLRSESHSDFIGRLWSLPWPWSTISATIVTLMPDLAYLWTGMLLCLLLRFLLTGRRQLPRIARGLWVSVVAYSAVAAIVQAVPQNGLPINIWTATTLQFFTNPAFLLFRLPGFLALIVSIRAALPVPRRTDTKTA